MTPARAPDFDAAAVRREFPILATSVHGKPLVYLDSAATTQKPRCVIDAVGAYYETTNANIHRAVHALSERATRAFEAARAAVATFINAPEARSVIFVRGTTEAINLVAQTYGRQHVAAGDEVLISALEHHSNIVPWQMLCDEKRAQLRVAPIDDAGDIVVDAFVELLSARTRIVAINHVSNALGTINPVRDLIAHVRARAPHAVVLVDGAQAVAHARVDVRDLDADFYAFSGHKLYGPTGIGVLYGRASLLEAMPPWQGGGDMISSVTFERTTYAKIPNKFEAGTPDIAGVIGLAAAIAFVNRVGLAGMAAYENDLLDYATGVLLRVPGLRMIGTARRKASVLSFVMDGIHPHDLGTALDLDGIAVRTGHHCAQPVMDRFGVPATARASLAVYNTPAEIDALAQGLVRAAEVFR